MTREPSPPQYTLGEEIANSVTHGVGLVLAVVGLVVLIADSVLHGSAAHVAASAVFGVTLILLYTASTLYHSIPLPRAKAVLRAIDHSAIYLLIAGTYTPFCVVSLRGPWGWSLLALVWTGALVGIGLRIAGIRRPVASVVIYVLLGWAVLLAAKPMLEAVAPGGLLLLLLGGVTYTGGILFYAWRRPYHHAVWHAFVLLGSVLHFFAVLLYVVPAGTPH